MIRTHSHTKEARLALELKHLNRLVRAGRKG